MVYGTLAARVHQKRRETLKRNTRTQSLENYKFLMARFVVVCNSTDTHANLYTQYHIEHQVIETKFNDLGQYFFLNYNITPNKKSTKIFNFKIYVNCVLIKIMMLGLLGYYFDITLNYYIKKVYFGMQISEIEP